MKVLFVGATGAVGRGVLPFLRPHFDLHLAAREPDVMDGSPVQAIDICDFEATEIFVREAQVDAVVNCAIADYRMCRYNRGSDVLHRYHESMFDVNIRGAYHLYEAAARAGVKKFVFISSMTVIAGYFPYKPLSGGEAARPTNIYACTKHFGEEMGDVYSMHYGLSVTCLRLGQPYPIFNGTEDERMAQERVRALYVHMEDIAGGINCALREEISFATYPIISASDVSFVDPNCTEALGYQPRYYFAADGVRLRDL